ncbi:MAG: hypothetical protein Q9197_000539 [Variospora fuerteventurae]
MAREKFEDEELNAQSPSSSQDFTANGEKQSASRKQSVANVKLQNPLADMTYDELMADVNQFAEQYDLQYALDDLQKGALIAQKRSGFEKMDRLTDEDKTLIREEKLHRWRQPKMMYYMTSATSIRADKYIHQVLCAGSAIVQGMDQSAVNGAQAFYFPYFGITDDQVWLQGLINGAPYLCSAVIGCFIAGVVFSGVKIPAGVEDTQWRIILGSTAIPPLFVCAQVYLVPESPRWYMSKGRYGKAFASLQRFRWSRFQAARDLYYIHKQIAIEYEMQKGKKLWKEFFAVPRNRRAAQSSFFVMFMQQVNPKTLKGPSETY